MSELNGKIIKISEIGRDQIDRMFWLMNEFYDNMDFPVFIKDLLDKDYCIMLYDESSEIQGFSTQKIMELTVCGKDVHGVFSGDTIIHKAHWGSPELFIVFTRFFFEYAKKFDEFYWFLISKGYKTYKILTTFFQEYYPCYNTETPVYLKGIIDAYATALYGGEYNPSTGVIEYKSVKDILKSGVADIDERARKDKNIEFFERVNPNYSKGYDLACITRIHEENVRPGARRMLFRK